MRFCSALPKLSGGDWDAACSNRSERGLAALASLISESFVSMMRASRASRDLILAMFACLRLAS